MKLNSLMTRAQEGQTSVLQRNAGIILNLSKCITADRISHRYRHHRYSYSFGLSRRASSSTGFPIQTTLRSGGLTSSEAVTMSGSQPQWKRSIAGLLSLFMQEFIKS